MINVNDYQHLLTDSAMLQTAVREAAQRGEEVLIPAINARTGEKIWNIDQTVFLPDNTHLVLEDAHLRLTDDMLGRMFQNENALTPLGKTPAGRQNNISIRGIGQAILDGGKYPGISEKTWDVEGFPRASENMMLYFHNVEHVRVENLTIRDQRYWSTCLMYCSDVTIRDIRFESHCNVPNQDGVDVHAGCHNVLIENLRGCTGDDVVAITSIDLAVMADAKVEGMSPDIHDVIVRNLNVFAANGCALVRILNHDGAKIYNVLLDGIIEASPWSETDAVTAPNPDLYGYIDETHHFVMDRPQILGEYGYRADAAIRIGENFWYGDHPAEPGDTWGITIRNVSTHAQSAITVCNTLYDSCFENIRLFGNGFRAVLFNNGDVKNVTFRDITWTENCRPHPEDKQVDIEWNDTHTKGLSAVSFSGTKARNLRFTGMTTGYGLESIFGGYGDVELIARDILSLDEKTLLVEDRTEHANAEENYRIRMRETEDSAEPSVLKKF